VASRRGLPRTTVIIGPPGDWAAFPSKRPWPPRLGEKGQPAPRISSHIRLQYWPCPMTWSAETSSAGSADARSGCGFVNLISGCYGHWVSPPELAEFWFGKGYGLLVEFLRDSLGHGDCDRHRLGAGPACMHCRSSVSLMSCSWSRARCRRLHRSGRSSKPRPT
jgi:hypothetical protein